MQRLLVPVFLFGILGIFSVYLITAQGLFPIAAIFGALMLTMVAFKANERVLPTLILLTLALGSCFNWQVAEKSFYIRFFLLFLVAFRGVSLWVQPQFVQRPQSLHKKTILHIAFLMTAVFGMMSSFYSVAPMLSFQRAFSLFLLYIVIFAYFWIKTEEASDCEEFALAMLRGLIVILSVGFLFLFLGVPGMFKAGRLQLVLGNPNQLGNFCAFMASIAVWSLFEKTKTRGQQIVGWSVVIGIVVSLIWSGSRTSLLASALSLGFLFFFCYRAQLFRLFLVISFIASLHLVMEKRSISPVDDPSFLEQTVLRQKNLAGGSGRVEVWKAAVHLIKQKPFFGYGFGVVDKLFRNGYFPELPNFQGGHVHNSYLEELVNIGWLGSLPIFLALLYLLATGVFRLCRLKTEVTPQYRLACALFGTVMAGVISGGFESWFTSVGSVFCFPYWSISMVFLKTIHSFNDWDVAA